MSNSNYLPSPVAANANPGSAQQLARLARETTRDNPWPLSLLAQKLDAYIQRLDTLWVEGQIVQLNERPASRMSFLTLRDTQVDMSMEVTTYGSVLANAASALTPGSRVVAQVTPKFWTRSGRFVLHANEIHPVGIGDLLAQIEQLRQRLATEGIFDAEHKRPLPLIPRLVGLVCGRNAKAKDDVIVNASARWPSVRFEVREVAVQGVQAVAEVTAAMRELDEHPQVDVIVVARGGGSVEDLLPFSDEAIVRTGFALTTALVSAIGHEADAPLLDLVADYRASTPTDAARRIVPDWKEESVGLSQAVSALRHRVNTRISHERERLELLVNRPVLTSARASLDSHFHGLEMARTKLRGLLHSRLHTERAGLAQAHATLRAISPQATLERGYSILRAPGSGVLTDVSSVKKGTIVEATLARGSMILTVFGTQPVSVEAAPPGGD